MSFSTADSFQPRVPSPQPTMPSRVVTLTSRKLRHCALTRKVSTLCTIWGPADVISILPPCPDLPASLIRPVGEREGYPDATPYGTPRGFARLPAQVASAPSARGARSLSSYRPGRERLTRGP